MLDAGPILRLTEAWDKLNPSGLCLPRAGAEISPGVLAQRGYKLIEGGPQLHAVAGDDRVEKLHLEPGQGQPGGVPGKKSQVQRVDAFADDPPDALPQDKRLVGRAQSRRPRPE